MDSMVFMDCLREICEGQRMVRVFVPGGSVLGTIERVGIDSIKVKSGGKSIVMQRDKIISVEESTNGARLDEWGDK